MTEKKFIQIHTLTSYAAALLNRDDAGFAKRIPFGGKTRTRVSSQCLKYHWRHHNGLHSLYGGELPQSQRSRVTFGRLVVEPLVKEGHPEPLALAIVHGLKELVISEKKVKKGAIKSVLNPKDDEDPRDAVLTNQVTVLGAPEIRYLKQLAGEVIAEAKAAIPDGWDKEHGAYGDDEVGAVLDALSNVATKDLKKNLRGMKLASGLDAALFGRMTTSDILARGDAALHVAHAFTTHAQASESDYFSAVDELAAAEGKLGGGHINSTELTSGLFYGYVVIDVPLLISNIEGCARDEWRDADRGLAADVIERFIHMVATVSPGAKLGSTAPYAHAEAVLVEAGADQPRTLANAFRKAVLEEPDVLENSYQALGRYVRELDHMYQTSTERRLAARGPVEGLVDSVSAPANTPLPEIATWTANVVRG